jgi:hypothetical protein
MNLSAAMLLDITSFNLPTRLPCENASEAKARKLVCRLAISNAAETISREACGGDEWSPDDVLMNSRRVPLRHGGNFEGFEISWSVQSLSNRAVDGEAGTPEGFTSRTRD